MDFLSNNPFQFIDSVMHSKGEHNQAMHNAINAYNLNYNKDSSPALVKFNMELLMILDNNKLASKFFGNQNVKNFLDSERASELVNIYNENGILGIISAISDFLDHMAEQISHQMALYLRGQYLKGIVESTYRHNTIKTLVPVKNSSDTILTLKNIKIEKDENNYKVTISDRKDQTSTQAQKLLNKSQKVQEVEYRFIKKAVSYYPIEKPQEDFNFTSQDLATRFVNYLIDCTSNNSYRAFPIEDKINDLSVSPIYKLKAPKTPSKAVSDNSAEASGTKDKSSETSSQDAQQSDTSYLPSQAVLNYQDIIENQADFLFQFGVTNWINNHNQRHNVLYKDCEDKGIETFQGRNYSPYTKIWDHPYNSKKTRKYVYQELCRIIYANRYFNNVKATILEQSSKKVGPNFAEQDLIDYLTNDLIVDEQTVKIYKKNELEINQEKINAFFKYNETMLSEAKQRFNHFKKGILNKVDQNDASILSPNERQFYIRYILGQKGGHTVPANLERKFANYNLLDAIYLYKGGNGSQEATILNHALKSVHWIVDALPYNENSMPTSLFPGLDLIVIDVDHVQAATYKRTQGDINYYDLNGKECSESDLRFNHRQLPNQTPSQEEILAIAKQFSGDLAMYQTSQNNGIHIIMPVENFGGNTLAALQVQDPEFYIHGTTYYNNHRQYVTVHTKSNGIRTFAYDLRIRHDNVIIQWKQGKKRYSDWKLIDTTSGENKDLKELSNINNWDLLGSDEMYIQKLKLDSKSANHEEFDEKDFDKLNHEQIQTLLSVEDSYQQDQINTKVKQAQKYRNFFDPTITSQIAFILDQQSQFKFVDLLTMDRQKLTTRFRTLVRMQMQSEMVTNGMTKKQAYAVASDFKEKLFDKIAKQFEELKMDDSFKDNPNAVLRKIASNDKDLEHNQAKNFLKDKNTELNTLPEIRAMIEKAFGEANRHMVTTNKTSRDKVMELFKHVPDKFGHTAFKARNRFNRNRTHLSENVNDITKILEARMMESKQNGWNLKEDLTLNITNQELLEQMNSMRKVYKNEQLKNTDAVKSAMQAIRFFTDASELQMIFLLTLAYTFHGAFYKRYFFDKDNGNRLRFEWVPIYDESYVQVSKDNNLSYYGNKNKSNLNRMIPFLTLKSIALDFDKSDSSGDPSSLKALLSKAQGQFKELWLDKRANYLDKKALNAREENKSDNFWKKQEDEYFKAFLDLCLDSSFLKNYAQYKAKETPSEKLIKQYKHDIIELFSPNNYNLLVNFTGLDHEATKFILDWKVTSQQGKKGLTIQNNPLNLVDLKNNEFRIYSMLDLSLHKTISEKISPIISKLTTKIAKQKIFPIKDDLQDEDKVLQRAILKTSQQVQSQVEMAIDEKRNMFLKDGEFYNQYTKEVVPEFDQTYIYGQMKDWFQSAIDQQDKKDQYFEFNDSSHWFTIITNYQDKNSFDLVNLTHEVRVESFKVAQ